MKIGLRGGHSINVIGAVGLRDEYSQMQSLYRYVRDVLEKYGHTVIDCNSNANTESAELREGTNIANSNNVDLYVTLHMNSFNGQAYGTEAWVYANRGLSGEIATRLVENYGDLGFFNRGVKVSTTLHDLRESVAPAIVFESCFCDSAKDIGIWSPVPWETLARSIANAIDPNIPLKEDDGENNPSNEEVYYRVCIGSFRDRSNAEAQVQEAKAKGFTDAFIIEYRK